MTITKRICTGVLAFAMLFATVFAMGIPASAATCSNGISKQTISVTTKANYLVPGSESITIQQTKGVCSKYNIFTKKTKTSKQYGEWNIVAVATDGSHKTTATLKGSSVKIKLKPNKTYNITVTWDSDAEFFKEVDKGNYTTYPSWKVKSTWKVSSCS